MVKLNSFKENKLFCFSNCNSKGVFLVRTCRENIRDIIRYITVSKGIYQKEIAKRAGVSESLISRVVNDKADLFIDDWNNFCQGFNINTNSAFTGIVTSLPEDSEETQSKMLGRKDNFASGRTAWVHTYHFKQVWGNGGFALFCKENGVNPLNFININNKSNIHFHLRLAQASILKRKLKTKNSIYKMSRITAKDQLTHGKFHRNYLSLTGIDRLEALINNLHSYEKNHDYKIEDMNKEKGYLTLSFTLNDHVDKSLCLYDPILKDFNTNFKEGYILNFINEPSFIKRIMCMHKGSEKCILHVQI